MGVVGKDDFTDVGGDIHAVENKGDDSICLEGVLCSEHDSADSVEGAQIVVSATKGEGLEGCLVKDVGVSHFKRVVGGHLVGGGTQYINVVVRQVIVIGHVQVIHPHLEGGQRGTTCERDHRDIHAISH